MEKKKITSEQKIKANIAPKTSAGNPAQVDGVPVWSVDSGDSTLDVAADGLSAFLVSSNSPSVTVYRVKADADLGSGVEEIELLIELTVESPKAASLGVNFGEPENK